MTMIAEDRGTSKSIIGEVVYWEAPQEVEITTFREAMEASNMSSYVPNRAKGNTFSKQDISTFIQMLYEGEGDCFQLKNRGSFYFIPESFTGVSDKVESILAKSGGKLHRLPIMASERSLEAVKEAMLLGMTDTLASILTNIEELNKNSTNKMFQSTAQRILDTEAKVGTYSEILKESMTNVTERIEDLKTRLRSTVASLSVIV